MHRALHLRRPMMAGQTNTACQPTIARRRGRRPQPNQQATTTPQRHIMTHGRGIRPPPKLRQHQEAIHWNGPLEIRRRCCAGVEQSYVAQLALVSIDPHGAASQQLITTKYIRQEFCRRRDAGRGYHIVNDLLVMLCNPPNEQHNVA